MTEWLSIKDVEERLGVGNTSVYRLIDRGELAAYRVGRVLRVKAEDIDTYLQRVRIRPGQLSHLLPECARVIDLRGSQASRRSPPMSSVG